MERLDTLENNIPSMNQINEIDNKIDNNFNRVNGYIRNTTTKVKSLHSLKDRPERISKLENTFDTLGATLSSLKSKKEVTPVDKGPKFIFVPRTSTQTNTPSAGKEEVKAMKEVPVFKDMKGEALFCKTKIFDFVP